MKLRRKGILQTSRGDSEKKLTKLVPTWFRIVAKTLHPAKLGRQRAPWLGGQRTPELGGRRAPQLDGRSRPLDERGGKGGWGGEEEERTSACRRVWGKLPLRRISKSSTRRKPERGQTPSGRVVGFGRASAMLHHFLYRMFGSGTCNASKSSPVGLHLNRINQNNPSR